MKDFFQEKRSQLLIGIGFIAAYLAISLVTRLATSTKVIEFAFLTIAFGFAPAYYLRHAYKFKGLTGWLLHAGTLGLLLIPFLFLFFGWLNLNFIFEYSVLFLLLCSGAGLLTLFFSDGENIRKHLAVGKIDRVDVVIGAVFLAFSAVLTLQNFDQIYIHWDTFTFWGIDGKYIFENNQLRDQAFHADVLVFRYTSFHPIFHSIIYDLYGGIAEQFAAWINVYINFLAMFLIYLQVRKKSAMNQFIVSASILMISYSALEVAYLLSLHADVLSAFLLLVYFLVLTNDAHRTLETYWQRVFLLLMLATTFYFIKSPFLYFSIILIGVWVLYDSKFILDNLEKLIRNRGFVLSILGAILLWVMRFIYFAKIGAASDIEKAASNFTINVQPTTFNSFLEYLVDLSQYMVDATPYLLGFWCLALLSIFFVKEPNKKYLYLVTSTLLFFLLPIAAYIARQTSFQSESLPRYTSIVMYLFPLVLSKVGFVQDKVRKLGAYSIFGVASLFVFLNILWPMPLNERFTLSEGTYQSVMTKYAQYAEDVVGRTGPDARILIADDMPGSITSNRDIPAIFLRYFMIYNSVGGQYTIPTSNLGEYAVQADAEFILLLSYQDSFDACDQMLSTGRDYLIGIRQGAFTVEPGSCIFSEFEIVDLGEAIK
ncbi:MAG: hypothetical protein PVI99_05665 [Anaerolineales bacterium]|jgi:hypothetical protein